MTQSTLQKLETTQMRMLRWMAGISRLEKRSNESIRLLFGVESIELYTRQQILRWLGHVERREETHVTKVCQNIVVEGKRPRGRPKATWMNTVLGDLRVLGLSKELAQDRARWRQLISTSGRTPGSIGKKVLKQDLI